jgi:hypothetical protein
MQLNSPQESIHQLQRFHITPPADPPIFLRLK